MPNQWQAIIWTNDWLVYWGIYASLGLNKLVTGCSDTWGPKKSSTAYCFQKWLAKSYLIADAELTVQNWDKCFDVYIAQYGIVHAHIYSSLTGGSPHTRHVMWRFFVSCVLANSWVVGAFRHHAIHVTSV